VAILGGIGFTMSLFIGSLAFGDAAHDAQVRLGVLAGSLLSASIGYLALRLASRR
jgi:NhaA family Na+:H+ antiporter